MIGEYTIPESEFYEGLEFYNDNQLLKSSGLNGLSEIGFLDIDYSTKVISKGKKVNVPNQEFGEGSTFFHNHFFLMTYTEFNYYVYDENLNLEEQGKMPSEFKEGWGLTHDSQFMYASDGTDKIFKIDENFKIIDTIPVTFSGQEIDNINELELVGDYIYANVWLTNFIVKIETATGVIATVYDMSELTAKAFLNSINPDVLNGIAYRKKTDTFFVTGKKFNMAFEVKLL